MSIENQDVEIMIALKGGDATAFEKILKKYEKPIINYIYRFIGDRAEAEDITQEVFLRVYKSKDSYKPTAKFSTWLYKIATNLCIDYKRKINRDAIGYSGTELSNKLKDTTSSNPVESSLEREQLEEIIKISLSSLPENQRIALTLKVYENKSYQEISEILGCSVSAVESLIFRARQNLKEKLSFLKQ